MHANGQKNREYEAQKHFSVLPKNHTKRKKHGHRSTEVPGYQDTTVLCIYVPDVRQSYCCGTTTCDTMQSGSATFSATLPRHPFFTYDHSLLLSPPSQVDCCNFDWRGGHHCRRTRPDYLKPTVVATAGERPETTTKQKQKNTMHTTSPKPVLSPSLPQPKIYEPHLKTFP